MIFIPANIPVFRIPDKSQAGDQLDQLCQEDRGSWDEHVSRPDFMKYAPMHYRLRGSMGFEKYKKVGKTRPLFLIQ